MVDKGATSDASPSPSRLPSTPLVTRLVPGLPFLEVEKKIHENERYSGAGDRGLAFYLADLKDRELFKEAGCRSFSQYLENRTSIGVDRGRALARVGKKLDQLPLLDQAFAQGKIPWSSARAAASVASRDTDAFWAEYCSNHTSTEVERRAAETGGHEDPRERGGWDGRPVKFPYSMKVPAHIHQAIESWCNVLAKENGGEVTLVEAIFEAVRRATALALAADDERGAAGKRRKLPANYRLVIYGDGENFFVPTVDRPQRISKDLAKRLLGEDPEVLYLNLSAAESRDLENAEKRSSWNVFSSQVEADSHLLIEHAPDLSTPEKPAIPKKQRDKPADAEMVKRVLSRDPICRIPGCGCFSERAHHIVYLEHGGLTIESNLAGLCRHHHHMVHAGLILMSGTAHDLRISDAHRRPLVLLPASQESPVRVELAPPLPDPDPPAAAPDEGPGQPAGAERNAPPAPVTLPAEIDRRFWLAHRGLFGWSERQKVLAYRPELAEELPADRLPIAPASTAPPPAEDKAPGLKEFRGQRRAVENIALAVEAARIRGDLPPPILLSGPPGLGKSTISKRIALELRAPFHQAQGPSLADLGSLVNILPDLEKGSVLFIDEIHRVPAPVAELLYQALDEGALSIPVLAGGRIRLVKIRLEPFVLIGATTEECLLPRPLLSRFGIRERLSFYGKDELLAIAVEAARSKGIELTMEGASVLAHGARGTPRTLLAHLVRARDLAAVEGGPITDDVVRRALRLGGFDGFGLSETDRRILQVLFERRRPLGLRSLSDILGENPQTVADVYEPYLLREGYIVRTSRGRIATKKARKALLFSVIDGLEIGFEELDGRSAG